LILGRAGGMIRPKVGPTDRDPVMEELFVETIIGIALIIISALEIVWITRTVTANTPR
jgi:energy-converting hydrogenase Eha subunit E